MQNTKPQTLHTGTACNLILTVNLSYSYSLMNLTPTYKSFSLIITIYSYHSYLPSCIFKINTFKFHITHILGLINLMQYQSILGFNNYLHISWHAILSLPTSLLLKFTLIHDLSATSSVYHILVLGSISKCLQMPSDHHSIITFVLRSSSQPNSE